MLIIRINQISQMKKRSFSIFSVSVPGVNDATAVVVGKYAIVGIDVKQNLIELELNQLNTLLQKV